MSAATIMIIDRLVQSEGEVRIRVWDDDFRPGDPDNTSPCPIRWQIRSGIVMEENYAFQRAVGWLNEP